QHYQNSNRSNYSNQHHRIHYKRHYNNFQKNSNTNYSYNMPINQPQFFVPVINPNMSNYQGMPVYYVPNVTDPRLKYPHQSLNPYMNMMISGDGQNYRFPPENLNPAQPSQYYNISYSKRHQDNINQNFNDKTIDNSSSLAKNSS
ncbi:MAG: hypothetical protein MHPSP_001254, partial [Paramarteilia canceri]